MVRNALFGAVLATALTTIGCGRSSSFETVPVTGTAQLAGGGTFKGFAKCEIRFEPTATTGEFRAASGKIQEDGSFTLTTQTDDGALPGKYLIVAKIMKTYPPSPAEVNAVWVCDPKEVEVTDGMDPVTIKISKGR